MFPKDSPISLLHSPTHTQKINKINKINKSLRKVIFWENFANFQNKYNLCTRGQGTMVNLSLIICRANNR